MATDIPAVTIENASILFRNFAGKKTMYKPEGYRNFTVELDQDTAAKMLEDGWNIRTLKAREEDDPERPILEVAVKYDYRPPRIVLVTSRGRTTLPEELVGTLDAAEISNVDLMINASQWEVNGKTGIKAYLKSMYITIEEDELDRKYADVPDAGANLHRSEPPWDE